MKRAIIYTRVSSKRQADDGLPLESQLASCRAKAEQLGAEVLREFVDSGISGTTDKRPAFQEAINYCSLMNVDYFITWLGLSAVIASRRRIASRRAVTPFWRKPDLQPG